MQTLCGIKNFANLNTGIFLKLKIVNWVVILCSDKHSTVSCNYHSTVGTI